MLSRSSDLRLDRRSGLVAATVLATATLTLAPQRAQAQQIRYASTSPGGIVATGNTLGLSKQANLNGPGTQDSIGTFISLDPTSVDNVPQNVANPWPAGTTWDWTKNGSEAVLTLPQNAEVLYAELVWGGSYRYGTEDVSNHLDDAVTLRAAGQATAVTPDAATALTVDEASGSGFDIRYYLRSAEVTPFVKQHGSATYAVAGVPATQDMSVNALNAAGWTLLVAYRAEFSPIRNLSVFVGGSFVDENTSVDYGVSGFCSPPTGKVEGRVIVTALEGDASRTGDELLIAETASGPFAKLSGPNNPESNFFCSQINGSDGQLDTSGSFGDANHDAFAGTNVPGGRQGWDVTTLPLSSAAGQLQPGQTSAVVRTNTTGDSYLPVAVALAIDVNAPVLGQGSSFESDVDRVKLGDEITLTAKLANTGQADAEHLTLSMPLQANLELKSFMTDGVSGDVNGQPVTPAVLQTGAPEGTLSNGDQRTVTMKLKVNGPPANNSYFPLTATWGYDYRICTNDAPVHESIEMVTLFVTYESEQDAGTGGAAGASGGGGAGGTSGGGGAAGDGGSGGAAGTAGGAGMGGSAGTAGAPPNLEPELEDAGSSGGCGCVLPGSARSGRWLTVLTVLGAALATMMRRRRG